MPFSIKKLFLLLFIPFCINNAVHGQAKTTKTIELVLKIKNIGLDPIANASISVNDKATNDLVAANTTPPNGTITYTLDLFREYIITISHKDYVTKKLWVDGNVPGKENNTKVYFYFEEIVHLLALSSDKLGAELIDKPFAKIYYNAQVRDINVDSDYDVIVKKEVAALTPSERAGLLAKLKGGSPVAETKKTGKPTIPGEDDPGFDFLGSTIKELVKKNVPRAEQSILTQASVTIFSGSDKLIELKTDKKDGRFRTRLEYGYIYKVAVSHPSTVPMFLTIDARIPKDKYDLRMGVEAINMPCVDKKSVNVDTVKYRFAFDKYMFDGKKTLVRDKKYFDDFLNGKTQEYLDYKALLREQNKNSGTENTAQAGPQKINYISGKILSGTPPSTPVKNVKVILTGDRGEPVQTCITSNFGRFLFSNVLLDQNYTIKVDEADMKQLNGQKITIINRNDKEVTVLAADAGGKFTFRLLSSDKKTLDLLASDEENLLISGNLLALINNITQPLANTKVQLVNEKGEMVEAVLTNEFGTFVFTKLPPNQSFLIELADGDSKLAGVRVIITDRNGKEVNSTVCNSQGKFKFEFLKQDELKPKMMEVEESELRLDLKGKLFKNTSQQALANTRLDLVNEKNQLVQSTQTDNAGNFKFSKVSYGKNYSLNASSQQAEKVILADVNGVVVKEYTAGGGISTMKMPLLPSDLQRITSVSFDDPWLKVAFTGNKNEKQETVVIPEKVYFELNDFKITTEGKVILDKVIQVMKGNPKVNIEVSSHTDSQGSDEYNLDLSKKRAKSAVDYMIGGGVSKDRLAGVGYGETKLVNKCANGELCSEEEHAQNRRLEFKVMYIK